MTDPAAALAAGLLERAGVSPSNPLADLLDDLVRFISRFVYFPNTAGPVAVALFVLGAHAIDAAETTLYLIVTSPQKRSGKTRLLEVLELLVPRPLRAANLSPSALFRTVAERVLLLDEYDAIFNPKSNQEDLRALLNAGYRKGAVVARIEPNGKKFELREFPVFSPKVLAGIGKLPDTIADRGIPITLHRRAPGEAVERFRYKAVSVEGQALRERAEAWAADAVADLQAAEPEIPEELNDRVADGWEPLLAIADMASERWAHRARMAASSLSGATAPEDMTAPEVLLKDCWWAFSKTAEDTKDKMSTEELCRFLLDKGHGAWGEWWRLRDATDTRSAGRKLARGLSVFGIRPKKVRLGDKLLQGYERTQFVDAWARYLPPQTDDDDPDPDPKPDSQPLPLPEAPLDGTDGTPQVDGGFPRSVSSNGHGPTEQETEQDSGPLTRDVPLFRQEGPLTGTETGQAADVLTLARFMGWPELAGNPSIAPSEPAWTAAVAAMPPERVPRVLERLEALAERQEQEAKA
jgi:Protein of unknown function (DUF3631)